MRTVVVGGSASNVGKTTLAVALTRAAALAGRCAAMKISVCEAPGVLRVTCFHPGDDAGHRKDTTRLLCAGAAAVVWVTVSRDVVRDGIAAGLRRARRLRPKTLVIESTSAGIELRAPSESYFVAGEGAWKPWAERHRARATHVVTSADVFGTAGIGNLRLTG
jgi:hypothetical protein